MLEIFRWAYHHQFDAIGALILVVFIIASGVRYALGKD